MLDATLFRESFKALTLEELREKKKFYEAQIEDKTNSPLSRAGHAQALKVVEDLIAEREK